MDSKKPWQSKTLIMAFIMAALPLVPGAGPAAMAWAAANPALFTAGISAVFAGLRVVTNGKVSIS